MVTEGGLDEAFAVFDKFGLDKQEVQEIDFTKGIMQAIGYKELYGLYIKTENKEQALEKLCQKTISYANS